MLLGLLTCRYLEMRHYDWVGISSIPTARGKVCRPLLFVRVSVLDSRLASGRSCGSTTDACFLYVFHLCFAFDPNWGRGCFRRALRVAHIGWLAPLVCLYRRTRYRLCAHTAVQCREQRKNLTRTRHAGRRAQRVLPQNDALAAAATSDQRHSARHLVAHRSCEIEIDFFDFLLLKRFSFLLL